MYMYSCTGSYTCTCTFTCAHVHVNTHTCTHTHTFTNLHKHAQTHNVHTHTQDGVIVVAYSVLWALTALLNLGFAATTGNVVLGITVVSYYCQIQCN